MYSEVPKMLVENAATIRTTMKTLDNKFQNIFCICDEYVINLFVCIYEVRKEIQKIT